MVASYNWKNNDSKKVVCVDFDGVLHDYSKGKWVDYSIASGPEIPGAIRWLKSLVDNRRFIVKIYSYRSKWHEGHVAIRHWLKEHGLSERYLEKIEFPYYKPVSFVTIDDRCIKFDGKNYPSIEEIDGFESWLE